MYKIKCVFRFFFVFTLCAFSSFFFVFAADGLEGEGTTENPYVIKNEEQLLKLVEKEYSLNACYILENDIFIQTKSWTPIGYNDGVGFTGTFDGNNHTISNVNILPITDSYTYMGFFYKNSGTVKNLNVEFGTVSCSGHNFGGIIGFNSGNVENCNVSGKIIFSDESTINSCGGIVAVNENGNITNSGVSSSIFGKGRDIGGIVGLSNGGNITNSYFGGEIDGVVAVYAGGVAGRFGGGEIYNCYSIGDISNNWDLTNDSSTGGLVGYVTSADVSIENSYNRGEISTKRRAGGLVGQMGPCIIIYNCYSIGTVSGNYCGGLVGYIGSENTNRISNSYAVSKVIGTTTGALIGIGDKSMTANLYFDKDVYGADDSFGYGLKTNEMKDQDQYIFWDFKDTWNIQSDLNSGYPYLKAINVPVSGINVLPQKLSLIKGDTAKVTASVYPVNAANKTYTWSSDNTDVAEVNSMGEVEAVGAGVAYITAKTAEGGYTDTCVVNVSDSSEVYDVVIFKPDNMSAVSGGKLSVPVRVTQNSTGICAFGIDVHFDKTLLTPDEVVNGEVFPDIMYNIEYGDGVVRITGAFSDNKIESGVAFYINFEVNPDAENSLAEITLTVDQLKTLIENNKFDLLYVLQSGKIDVQKLILGDVDGDGKVTAADATDVLRYYAKLDELDERQLAASDVNGDGKVTSADAVQILYKYSGYSVEW